MCIEGYNGDFNETSLIITVGLLSISRPCKTDVERTASCHSQSPMRRL